MRQWKNTSRSEAMAIGELSRNGYSDGVSCALGVVDIEEGIADATGEREATEACPDYQATVFVHL